ncbi:MAG TPA: 3-dehydroquinate synthase [Tepidisphaeraceae bacterium]|nr:3-dehydroquinate synthase [Tepidisphaeraceae bacterium]
MKLEPTIKPDREIHNRFAVDFEFRVIFSDRVFDPENPVLLEQMPTAHDGPARAIVFVDRGVASPDLIESISAFFEINAFRVTLVSKPVIVTGGEASKSTDDVFNLAVKTLNDVALDRHSYVVIVGGGAVLDAVGFASAVVHRGLRTIRLPTTVLAQNDAGIGVKNGIDRFGKKNFLGTFAPPWAVINDFTLLEKLPAHHWRDGIAEAIKVALIRDRPFFDWIEKNLDALVSRDEPSMRRMIFRCAELHLNHITTGGDPFERGSARPLDFGHWSAHKLEQMSNFTLSHGHAVAVGMMIDCAYARSIGLLDSPSELRIRNCLERAGFEMDVGRRLQLKKSDLNNLLAGLDEFQEHLGGRLSITMLKSIGTARELDEIDREAMLNSLEQILF